MSHKILVVDDEPHLETLISQRFRKRIRAGELSFQFAGNGAEAMTVVQADADLDVVLTDINMPVMDGLTLLSRLREAHPHLRAVIVSAYGDMTNIRTALNRGAFDFVTKPIDLQDLEITLDKAIGESLLRKQAVQDREHLVVINRELDLARGIQESLVPRHFPSDSRFEIYGTMIPASQVGGDLFDFFLLDANRIAVSVGDVSGKGLPAALFMAVSRTVLRVTAMKGLPPHECMEEVNRFLSLDQTTAMYLTCFYGILDLDSGKLEYSRAAHNAPYLVRAPAAGGTVKGLRAASGLPLGMFDSGTYDTASVQLNPGDCLVMYTDGVTEAANRGGEMYGEERLVPLLKSVAAKPARDVVQAAIDGVQAFAHGAPQSDDITVLALSYLGQGQ
ncbi:MAG: SpoIIE family protein phosphatase [Bryobacteraceae bacterium]